MVILTMFEVNISNIKLIYAIKLLIYYTEFVVILRPQGIMLQILLIMLFWISLKNPSLCSLLFFLCSSLLLLFYCTNNNTVQCTSVEMLNYKLCMTILHTFLYCMIIKFQWVLYCKIVKSDTHACVNEVTLGVSMVLANTEKPR